MAIFFKVRVLLEPSSGFALSFAVVRARECPRLARTTSLKTGRVHGVCDHEGKGVRCYG